MEVRYFQGITELPLSRFIECLVDKRITALIISGEPTQEQLNVAWNNILMEYNDAMGDSETKLYFQLMKESNYLMLTLKHIEVNIQLLSYRYDKCEADELKEMLDLIFDIDPSDSEKYLQQLKTCELRSGGIYLQYQLKKAEFDRIKEKGENKNFKPTKDYFLNLLITLSDHAKYPIHIDTVTVYEFCERMKRFGQYIKTINDNGKRG